MRTLPFVLESCCCCHPRLASARRVSPSGFTLPGRLFRWGGRKRTVPCPIWSCSSCACVNAARARVVSIFVTGDRAIRDRRRATIRTGVPKVVRISGRAFGRVNRNTAAAAVVGIA